MSTSTDRQDSARVTHHRAAPEFKEAPVDTYRGFDLFEHYNASGYLLLITSNPDAIVLEPGDFVVKRAWRTDVVPYLHAELAGGDENSDTAAATKQEPVTVGFLTTSAHLPCHSIQCAECFPGLAANLVKANAAMHANL